jgi:hypothetical protein
MKFYKAMLNSNGKTILNRKCIRRSLVAQSAATFSRGFFARGFFYPENGGDTFLRNVGSHKIYTELIPEDDILE